MNVFPGLRDPHGAWDITAYSKNIFNVQRVLTRTEANAGFTAVGSSAAGIVQSNYRLITTTPERKSGVIVHYAFGSVR